MDVLRLREDYSHEMIQHRPAWIMKRPVFSIPSILENGLAPHMNTRNLPFGQGSVWGDPLPNILGLAPVTLFFLGGGNRLAGIAKSAG